MQSEDVIYGGFDGRRSHVLPTGKGKVQGGIVHRACRLRSAFKVNAHLTGGQRRDGKVFGQVAISLVPHGCRKCGDAAGRPAAEYIDCAQVQGGCRAHHCHGSYGVSAKVQKIIVYPHVLQLQRFFKGAAKDSLRLAACLLICALQRGGRGRKQRPAIQLVVGVQRQRFQAHIERRYHIGGQGLSELAAQRILVNFPFRRIVCAQVASAVRLGKALYRGAADSLNAPQCRFRLARLYPLTVDFQHKVPAV